MIYTPLFRKMASGIFREKKKIITCSIPEVRPI
jgi:hypothetical protein